MEGAVIYIKWYGMTSKCSNIPKNVTSIHFLFVFCANIVYRLLLDPEVFYALW